MKDEMPCAFRRRDAPNPLLCVGGVFEGDFCQSDSLAGLRVLFATLAEHLYKPKQIVIK